MDAGVASLHGAVQHDGNPAMRPALRRIGAVGRIVFFALPLELAACHSPGRPASPFQPIEDVVRVPVQVVERVDPLAPSRKAADQVERAAAQIEIAALDLDAKINEMNVEQLNRSLGELSDVLNALRVRIEAVSPESAGRIGDQFAAIPLDTMAAETACMLVEAALALEAVHDLVGRTHERIDELDLARMNETLAQIQGLLESTTLRMQEIDIVALNRAIDDVSLLRSPVEEAVLEATARLAELRLVLEDTPRKLAASADHLQAALAGLSQPVRGLALTVWLANALLASLTLLTIVALVRLTIAPRRKA